MIEVLVHDILPVFAMLALGFALGRAGKATADEARAANRIAFIVMQPALIFPLVAQVDLGTFHLGLLGLYALCQAAVFAGTFLLARHVLGRDRIEAWLLAMATVFVNSLLYIWPITVLIYGEAGALPIGTIVAWDATVTFAFFIISVDLMAGGKGLGDAARRVALNPVLIAIVLGVALNLMALPVPEPVLTAARFAGAAAAPLTLFALGVILSGHALRPTATVAAVSAIKLGVFPLAVWGAIALFGREDPWARQFVLNSAGPSGAMAFSLAMLYGVRTDAIAPVIIWTSTLSLISLAALA